MKGIPDKSVGLQGPGPKHANSRQSWILEPMGLPCLTMRGLGTNTVVRWVGDASVVVVAIGSVPCSFIYVGTN